MITKPYDFRSPPPAEFERHVAAWADEACRRLRTAWAEAVPFPVTFGAGPVTSMTAPVAARLAPTDGYAVVCRTAPPVAHFLFGFPAELLRGLIAGLLGETPVGPPPPRSSSPTPARSAPSGGSRRR